MRRFAKFFKRMIRAGSQAGADERTRFRSEAEAIARLQHPNIVQIHQVGEVDGHPFCAVEFVPGGTLARRLAGTPLPPPQAALLLEILARAMEAAHRAGVVHRDLKPSNMLMSADGVPKVSDFGLGKQMDDPTGPTQTGQILGTPSYMAPEQASGQLHQIGPATDVYSLGAILYECLTGHPPFRAATTLQTLEQVRSVEPVGWRAACSSLRKTNPICGTRSAPTSEHGKSSFTLCAPSWSIPKA